MDNEEKMTETKNYEPLRRELVKALDSVLEEQGGRLRQAVEIGYTGEEGSELLIKAGLLEYLGDYGSLLRTWNVYKATQKGRELYREIFVGK